MGSRFVVSLITSFLFTVMVLAGAGYAVTRLAVPPPRDVFRTGFFEFEIAPGWECSLDGTEYVCQARGEKQRGAIAVIAMKERNPKMDTLELYEDHLRKPQRNAPMGDTTVPPSVVEKVGRITLGGKTWVEALHLGSEVQNYYTYYLGTVTSDIGILVTMSHHKDQGGTYLKDLTDMMSTLRAYQQ